MLIIAFQRYYANCFLMPYNVLRYATLLWEKAFTKVKFLYFFLLKCFFKKCNGIRFARSDDRSEVGMCMEWL
ncbi:hypothetical protein CA834_08380 [Winogradskyella aurantia]|uniref:Uncharacterized protein n=1 Tax=Winogradskyella aurantia TaxID=1915063 RepID=A0A265UT39_9FLAO|nr:hypothetical protein CA834_08380 [Winogradskyella aurantia]